MMVPTPVDAPLDIVLVEKTVQVSSFLKYVFKCVLDENDSNSKLRNDAVSEVCALQNIQIYRNYMSLFLLMQSFPQKVKLINNLHQRLPEYP